MTSLLDSYFAIQYLKFSLTSYLASLLEMLLPNLLKVIGKLLARLFGYL
jgi:hypothetical protein